MLTIRAQDAVSQSAPIFHRSTVISAPLSVYDHRDARAVSGSPQYETAQALISAGKFDKAEKAVRSLLRAVPGDPEALYLAGMIANGRGHHKRAVQLLEKACAGAPDSPKILCDLGHALKKLDRLDEAIAIQRRVTELLPTSALAWSNLGSALSVAGHREEAVSALVSAAGFDPEHGEIWYNLGNAELAAGNPQAAEKAFRNALYIEPAHRGAATNLVSALKDQGRIEDAEDILVRMMADRPGVPSLIYNWSLLLLATHRYEEGWAAYEARRALPDFAIRTQPFPPWDGQRLAGRSLLIHAEQGLGDAIQFCRYARLAAALDGEVTLEAPGQLLPLLETLSPEIALRAAGHTQGHYDFQAPLMSMPYLTRKTAPFWPEEGPYLHAEPDRVARWRNRLGPFEGLTIAICWQGNPDYRADVTRSVPLAAFAPLAALDGVRLVSLQHGAAADRLAERTFPRRDPGAEVLTLGAEIDRDGTFLDSAAILECADLLVTSDTAIAHLGGALGRETWVALSHVPDWRWGLRDTACGWYPTMRLFRQPGRGNWVPLFETIAGEAMQRLS